MTIPVAANRAIAPTPIAPLPQNYLSFQTRSVYSLTRIPIFSQAAALLYP
ncbi:MAG: hypothetical protein KME11_15685 [Timaviella obliquedivisa GSE-PSE-MK23-08B]|nr:hypothetical protein [Timaviella obliquedivisa GSE-PSE-MK23-08B]